MKNLTTYIAEAYHDSRWHYNHIFNVSDFYDKNKNDIKSGVCPKGIKVYEKGSLITSKCDATINNIAWIIKELTSSVGKQSIESSRACNCADRSKWHLNITPTKLKEVHYEYLKEPVNDKTASYDDDKFFGSTSYNLKLVFKNKTVEIAFDEQALRGGGSYFNTKDEKQLDIRDLIHVINDMLPSES